MNSGAMLLLKDAEGRISGGDQSVNPRGGIFGPQGYGGGVFDGSMALGQVEPGYPEGDCAALCSLFMAFPAGPALVAACAEQCKTKTATVGCYAPSVCKQMAALYPGELDPSLVDNYCALPPEMQHVIDTACNALAISHPASLPPALPGGQAPPVEPVPPRIPGVIDPTVPPPPGPGEQPPPETEAGIGLGTVAVVGGVVALGLWFVLKKR